MSEKITDFSTFRGKPLLRSGNVITYGDPKDKAILILTVLTTKQILGEEIPDKIFLQIQSTTSDEVFKQAEKDGLYEALDFGAVWLERELKK